MTFRAGIYLAVLSMAAIVILSNILVHFLLGEWLTYAAFTYPFAFLITDLSNRLYGSKVAQLIVLIGFFTGILGSLIGTQIYGEFGPLVTLRVAIASGTAFLLSQLLDIKLFSLFFSKKVLPAEISFPSTQRTSNFWCFRKTTIFDIFPLCCR